MQQLLFSRWRPRCTAISMRWKSTCVKPKNTPTSRPPTRSSTVGRLLILLCFMFCMNLITCPPVFLLQGALDVRYLAARYENGKRWVSDFMEKKHRFRNIPIANAHADILLWQQEAPTKFLGHCDIEFPNVAHLYIECFAHCSFWWPLS